MTEHLLTGATPEPLASYLTGLAVLRLLAEQGHPGTTAHWDDRGMVLRTDLGRNGLLEFFLDRYVPTPMVSPWNKGAGYRGNGKSKSAEELVERASASTNPRFRELRGAMEVAKDLNAAYPEDSAYVKAKDSIIQQARSRMPDSALGWIDAAVTLTADGPVFPHILGTGGNLGRLDLSSNALSHLDSLIGFDGAADATRSREWLEDALFATGSKRIKGASVGQYEPGMVGGSNASSSGDGTSLANPWSFVLTLEGAVLFASGLARRLGGANDNVAAMPFTVRPDAAGAAHLSPYESAKGEIWLPLWSEPAGYHQVQRLFAEGRLRWRGRTATRGIDAARAVATLGAHRGIQAFTRIAIVERLGQSPLAIPAGRLATGSSRAPALTAALDPWLNRLRRVRVPPTSLTRQLRSVDDILIRVSTSPDRTATRDLRLLLNSVYKIERSVWQNRDLRSHGPPAPVLERSVWLPLLNDGSTEFRLAAALTSARDGRRKPSLDGSKDTEADSNQDSPTDTQLKRQKHRDKSGQSLGRWRPSVMEYVRPVALRGWSLNWDTGPALVLDPAVRPMPALAVIHESHATQPVGSPAESSQSDKVSTGTWTWFGHMDWVGHRDVERLLALDIDQNLFAEHLLATSMLPPGLSNTDSSQEISSEKRPSPTTGVQVAPAHPGWRLLTATFHASRLAEFNPSFNETPGAPQPDAIWIPALVRGSVRPVLASAIRQLHHLTKRDPAGQDASRAALGADGPIMAAALLFHLNPSSARSIIEWCCPKQDDDP